MRDAMAVPIWQATMPRKLIVVACCQMVQRAGAHVGAQVPAAPLESHQEDHHHQQRGDPAQQSPGPGQHRSVDDVLRALPGRAIHQTGLGPFPAERQRGQGLGAEVDRQNLHHGQGQPDPATRKGVDEKRDNLWGRVGEDVDDELADIVVDPSACFDRGVTMVAKLSSVRTIVAASRATSVPDRPIATPMSARRSAGASLTPSPVIATT